MRDFFIESIGWLGRPGITAHSHSRRVDQFNWPLLVLVVFQVVVTQEDTFPVFIDTFHAQPRGFLVTLLAGLFGHLVAGQQADRVFGRLAEFYLKPLPITEPIKRMILSPRKINCRKE